MCSFAWSGRLGCPTRSPAFHHPPVDLCRRAGGAGLARRTLGRALYPPQRASAHGLRSRAGIFAGYVFVIPGLAAISIAGLLGVPLGRWLLFGIVIGPITAIITTIIMRLILRGGLWKPESDEDVDEAMIEQEAHEMALARAERVPPTPMLAPSTPTRMPTPRFVPPMPTRVSTPRRVPPMQPDRCRWACCCCRSWCPWF